MRQLFMMLLLSTPLAWAQGCGTPQSFAAMVALIVNEGEPADYGLSLAAEERPYKYHASLVRGTTLPELYLMREKWTRRGNKDRVDQWVMKFTAEGSSVLHKEMLEENHRLVREKRLSNKGADQVGCHIFRKFLGAQLTLR
jgi:hypothetical protein